MPKHNLVTWNTLITASAYSGNVEYAEELFQRMPERDEVTWNAMLSAYAHNRHLEEAKRFFEEMPSKNVVAWNILMHAYCEEGKLDEVKGLFERMPSRNAATWTCLIEANADYGHLEDAQSVFDNMPERNVVTWTSLVAVAWTSIVAAYADNGRVCGAKKLFDSMPRKDLCSWNVVASMYARYGFCREAIEIFKIMCLEGFDPDGKTYVIVLAACSHIGLVREGLQKFTCMEMDHGILAQKDHYRALAASFGRAGELRNAEDLTVAMDDPDGQAWRAFLGACSVHFDVRHGVSAAKHALVVGPEAGSAYILLSNTLALENTLKTSYRKVVY
ncbi:hypothetical protein SELMODRAFT_101336 [Selaginella moellendorffii]|uniref:Pentacotripeptide-repeat region of PRORP domain-containing protein n=1 Tax=Selaginella moellendorffii TaxID=88036 RepID=D8RTE9_SELML|nr:hypothetical protein SELMODRAFT_101336 [Selaginella moellendorffii]